MTKYAAKGEPKSQPVQSLYKSCVECLSDTSNAKKFLKSAMIRSVAERDFSAQETCHMLLSLPLFSCSYNFVTVALNASRKLKKDQDTGELTLEDSVLDTYASRNVTLADLNLCLFAANYRIVCGKAVKRASPVVVRTFPTFSSNPQGDNYPLYCKYQLIKYRPWTITPSNAWEIDGQYSEDYVTVYNEFLQTDVAKRYVPNFGTELDHAQRYIANHDDDDDSEEEPNSRRDEWMLCCQINQRYANDTISTTVFFDWAAFARSLPPSIIQECPSRITRSRTACAQDPISPWHRQLPQVDVSTLNEKQQLAYSIILQHHLDIKQPPPPLRMIVCGTAGTGKSYLISAIAQTLDQSCILTGTTGMASFNICGKTLHSTLNLPVKSTTQQPLQGSALQRLQQNIKDKHYLIIDEMSMMGHRMLAWVDQRLRQATGN